MGNTLKCFTCKIKYRIFPKALIKDGKVAVKHNSYELYNENRNLKFWQIQKETGTAAKDVDFDKKGRTVCTCPKCHKMMAAV